MERAADIGPEKKTRMRADARLRNADIADTADIANIADIANGADSLIE
jgi:hypothetical protein